MTGRVKTGISIALPMPVIHECALAVGLLMPHNLFLSSKIIQCRKWNLKEEAGDSETILNLNLRITLFSMIIGWAINSAYDSHGGDGLQFREGKTRWMI